MYQQCPKCGFENGPLHDDNVCAQCGLIFDKWLKNQYKKTLPAKNNEAPSMVTSQWHVVKEQLLSTPDAISKEHVYLNLGLYTVFLFGAGRLSSPTIIQPN